MDTVLHISDVAKSFDGLRVLDHVFLQARAGSITAIFGENGSGKTTLFNLISGFDQADHGEIHYKGDLLNRKPPAAIASLGIGRLWQTPKVCRNLTVLDNLLLAVRNHPGDHFINYVKSPGLVRKAEQASKTMAEEVLNQIGLHGKPGKTAGELSFGQQKILSLGMLLINGADLLLLDEPFAGVSLPMIDVIARCMIDLKQKNKTLLMIEHNQIKAAALADQTYLLSKGVINAM